MSWQASTLGELAKRDGGLIQTGPFGSQLHQAEYETEGIPVVMPKDIADGRISSESVARVSEQTATRLQRHKLKPRSIVLPRRGEVTKRAYIRDEQDGWLCGTGCLKIELHGRYLVPEYLYYFMEQGHVTKWLLQHAVGTTMLNLSTSIVSALPIRYPSTVVQMAIAETLASYDGLIENNRRRMALLEESARLLYREWFVHLRFPGYEHTPVANGVPQGWERKTLGDLCSEIRDMVLPDALESDTPYIGLEHIPRRSISLNDWGTVEQVTSSKSRFKTGEIIFGKIRPYFHKVGVAFVDGVASSDAIVVRPTADVLRGLVLLTMSSDEFVAVTSQQMKEGSKMPRADWKQMKAYSVPLPPSGLLSNFDEVIQPIVEQLKSISFANQKLRKARDLLLPRLMSGELAV
jgi:type I restriction enzyme, S subunit